jgi:peroxiredoxin Q/BCP
LEVFALRDVWNKYRDAHIQLYGVSVDDLGSHASLAQKYALPFPIIVDKDTEWARDFGVPLRMGKASCEFLLAPDDKVSKVYPNVDPGTHAALVLEDVSSQSH